MRAYIFLLCFKHWLCCYGVKQGIIEIPSWLHSKVSHKDKLLNKYLKFLNFVNSLVKSLGIPIL